MSPNPRVFTCEFPPASTLTQSVSPLPEPPPLAPIPTTMPQCDWSPARTGGGGRRRGTAEVRTGRGRRRDTAKVRHADVLADDLVVVPDDRVVGVVVTLV